MKLHIQVTEVMRASNLLYVYARIYQTIHAWRPVSVRVLRSAVREWVCWMPVRLEPAAPQSQVKHSTTEPLHALFEVKG